MNSTGKAVADGMCERKAGARFRRVEVIGAP